MAAIQWVQEQRQRLIHRFHELHECEKRTTATTATAYPQISQTCPEGMTQICLGQENNDNNGHDIIWSERNGGQTDGIKADVQDVSVVDSPTHPADPVHPVGNSNPSPGDYGGQAAHPQTCPLGISQAASLRELRRPEGMTQICPALPGPRTATTVVRDWPTIPRTSSQWCRAGGHGAIGKANRGLPIHAFAPLVRRSSEVKMPG